MGKKNKDPLASWTGPQIDKTALESVLNSYFEARNEETNPAETAEFLKNQNIEVQKTNNINEIQPLTGSLTGSVKIPLPSVSTRLDATHTTSEAVLYSVMYRETHSKGTRTGRFSIPQLMRLSGIRSKNTVRRALVGLKEKLSIRELETAQATLPTLYEIRKIREIFSERSANEIEIDDRKVVRSTKGANPVHSEKVFHRQETLTGSKIDPLTGSIFDPLLNKEDLLNKEREITAFAVEKITTENEAAAPLISIFEQVLERNLTQEEIKQVNTEIKLILLQWATIKRIKAGQPIRHVTYLINGLREALVPKQPPKEADPFKLRRLIVKLLKDKWPAVNERAQISIGEAAEYIKQSLADRLINYSSQVSLISDTVTQWVQGVFDRKN